MSKEKKRILIRGQAEGLWYEVVAIPDTDNPSDVNKVEVLATFEIDYSEKDKKFKLKKILFDKEKTSREDRLVIMSYVREFIDSLNE